MTGASQQLMKGLLEAFILDSISREPTHGYALLKELSDVFGEPPNRNRVYPLLQRLEEEGLIVAAPESGGGPDPRGRNVYSLTGKGLQRLRGYKLMPAAFRTHLAAFWDLGAPSPSTGPSLSGASAGERVLPVLPPEGRIGCPEASVSLRRQRGAREVDVLLRDCDLGARPGCPACIVPAILRRVAAGEFGL